MKRITHIAPALPPAVNGVGDFCKILADNLAKEVAIKHSYLVTKSPDSPDENVDVFQSATFLSLLHKQNPNVIILHYVGYAYDKHGLPFYLASGIRQFKKSAKCKVLVFFHELFADSRSLLKLPFYTSGLQKLIVRQLCTYADSVFTNCQVYDEELNKITKSKRPPGICTGIFSNIPEELYDNREKETSSAVVFGSLSRRNAVYANKNLKAVLDNVKITTIYDVGPGTISCDYPNIDVKVMGPLPSEKLAVYLNKAKFGLLHYKPELLGKSGIFSAYTAFGVIPLNLLDTKKPLNDGLASGRNYFNRSDTHFRTDLLFNEQARHEVLSWYKRRSRDAVANSIRTFL